MRYIPGLDGIRALAVGAVVVFHARPASFSGGFLGVSVFFTLSGFLITALLLTELCERSTVDIGRFWARRVQRLAPAALAVAAAVVVVTRTDLSGWGLNTGFSLADAMAGAWNVANWHLVALDDDAGFRLAGPLSPYWSLAVEEQFYAAIALVFLAVRSQRLALRSLAIVFVVTWAASFALGIAIDGGLRREEFGTDIRAAEIAAGALLAVAVHGRPPAFERHRRLLDGAGWVALAVLALVFAGTNRDDAWLGNGGYALVSLVSTALVAGVLAGETLGRFLSIGPLAVIGRLSYAIYLVHWPVILVLRPGRVHLGGWPLVAVQAGVALVVAAVAHVAVERPLRRAALGNPRRVFALWILASAAVSLLALGVLS